MASATKFAWLLKHVPAVEEAARAGRLRLGTPDVWLTARLSGGAVFATDPGQASCTGLAGPGDAGFAEAALALFGLEPDWLPSLAPTSAVLGETPAALLGAPVALAARAGDQQAACFAQGVRAPGRGKLTLGTSAMLDVHTGDAPARPPRGAFALVLWELADGERAFCVEGSAVSAGSAVEWLVRLGILAEPAALDAAAADDAVGLVFVPALEGLGSPYNEPRARALLGGLTRGATRAHVARAVVDGVAHRATDLVETLPLAAGPLPVDGGLCGSRALLQAVADLSGRLVAPPREHETTALGAAFLAGRACGWAGDPAEGGAPPSGPLLRPRIDEAERRARRADWRRAVERCLADAADAGGSARRPG